MTLPKPQKEQPEQKSATSPSKNEAPYQELPDDAFFSPSKPKEEPGFSPVSIAIYIVVGLLLVAGIGGSIIGLRTTPLWMSHKPVSQRSISTRTTFKEIKGGDWTMTFQMMLSPSVAYFKVHLTGKAPIKYQLIGARYKIGNGSTIPLKLPPAYLMFEPMAPGETTERTLWLGGSPVDSITLQIRIDDGHGMRNDTLSFE
ncbi:MAG: hypothetical protein ACYCTV_01985 [Leptospirales bacterium]